MNLKIPHPLVLLYEKALNNYQQNYPYIRIRYNNIAFIGILGFPLYYLIWKYIYTQPYENLPLRLFGALFCSIILLEDKIPFWLRKFMPLYIYATTIFCLTFFFFFYAVRK
jgi:two-component system CAI-1 autoinducer sensor kinase/phosphatase CqsS